LSLGWWSAVIVAYHWQVLLSILPALERVHEFSGSLQAAAHHDGLLSDNGQGILQQPRLVLDRRRRGRHLGMSMLYSPSASSKVFLLPLRASPERLHWYGSKLSWYAASGVGWPAVVGCCRRQPSPQQAHGPAAFHLVKKAGFALPQSSIASIPSLHHAKTAISSSQTLKSIWWPWRNKPYRHISELAQPGQF
jgi:hypothetical protein